MSKARLCSDEIGALLGLVKCLMDGRSVIPSVCLSKLSLPAGHFTFIKLANQLQEENPQQNTTVAPFPFKGLQLSKNATLILKYVVSLLQAVGLGARFIKLGGLSRGERVTKYNRLLAIEEEVIHNGTWGMCRFSCFVFA